MNLKYTEAKDYNPNCYQCRILAGKEPAGVSEDNLCKLHLQQFYVLTKPLLETKEVQNANTISN